MPEPDNQRWPARFFADERTAGTPVRVHLSDRGIVISGTADDDELIWPYGALEAEPRVSPEVQSTTISYKDMPESRLEIATPGLGEKLSRYAPQVVASRFSLSLLKYVFIGAFLGAAIWMLVTLYNVQPARWIASAIPEATRQSLGRSVISSMAKRYRVCNSAPGCKSVDLLTAKLVGSTSLSSKPNVLVVDWSLVNAFAAPGGQLLLTNGFIRAARTPEEVAGVLAHEIGHSIELHPEAGIVRTVGIAAALDLIMGGGGGLSGIGNLLLRNRYARQDERAADEQALRLLREARISQSGLIDFFERIGRSQNGQAGSTIGGLFQTHPYPLERASRARRSPTYDGRQALTQEQWRALKKICNETKPLGQK